MRNPAVQQEIPWVVLPDFLLTIKRKCAVLFLENIGDSKQ